MLDGLLSEKLIRLLEKMKRPLGKQLPLRDLD